MPAWKRRNSAVLTEFLGKSYDVSMSQPVENYRYNNLTENQQI